MAACHANLVTGMSRAMRMAVCILHYGKAALTARLHDQFLDSTPGGGENVFVLDNASPEAYPRAWTRLPENIFWGGALGWALDAFKSAGYTHLWFCNNDMAFVSDPPYYERAVARLCALEKRGRVGLYSPAVTANPYHAQMQAIGDGKCRMARYIDGIAPVISLACVEAVGGLDNGGNPYGYGVDTWLSYRAATGGWGVWVDHSIIVRHKYHTAAKQEDGFLRQAALAENAYLTERFGPNWRETLRCMQTTQEERE